MAAPNDDAKSIPQVASELWELSVAYAKQETVDPLKGLGRYLAYGVGGAVTFGIGTVLLSLALLRALQTETDTAFTGSLSFIPYVLTILFLALVATVLGWRVVKRKGPGL